MHLLRLNEELLENLKNMQMKITYLNNNQSNKVANSQSELNNKNNKFEGGDKLFYGNSKINQRINELSSGDYIGNDNSNNNNYNYKGYNALNDSNKINSSNNNIYNSDGNKYQANYHTRVGSYGEDMPNNSNNQGDLGIRQNVNYKINSGLKNQNNREPNENFNRNNGYFDNGSENVYFNVIEIIISC